MHITEKLFAVVDEVHGCGTVEQFLHVFRKTGYEKELWKPLLDLEDMSLYSVGSKGINYGHVSKLQCNNETLVSGKLTITHCFSGDSFEECFDD